MGQLNNEKLTFLFQSIAVLLFRPVKGFGNPSKIELVIAAGVSKSGFKLHFEVGHRDNEPLLLLPSGSCRLDALDDFLTLLKLSETGASIKLIGTGLNSDSAAARLVLLEAFDLKAKPFPAIDKNPPLLLPFSSFNRSSGVRDVKSASDFWRLLLNLSEFGSSGVLLSGDWLSSSRSALTKLLDFR